MAYGFDDKIIPQDYTPNDYNRERSDHMNKFKYYEIDNRKFKLERISDTFCELTVYEDGEFLGTYCFDGNTAYEEAFAEILSYAEIDEKDYREE